MIDKDGIERFPRTLIEAFPWDKSEYSLPIENMYGRKMLLPPPVQYKASSLDLLMARIKLKLPKYNVESPLQRRVMFAAASVGVVVIIGLLFRFIK